MHEDLNIDIPHVQRYTGRKFSWVSNPLGKTKQFTSFAGEDYREMEQKIRPIAKTLGITELLDKFPYEVSGGQKQRAAVARALITNPKLVLADEPTGALDSRAASALLSMFGEINEEGQTILMVTHSAQAASHASRVLFIKDGEVFHQIYKGSKSRQEMYQMIADTLTILTTGGEYHA